MALDNRSGGSGLPSGEESLINKLKARGALPLIGAGIAIVAVIALVAVVAGGGGGDSDEEPFHAGLDAARETVTVEATIDLNRPTIAATASPNAYLPGKNSEDRIVISKIGVAAPISYKTVGLDGQMPDPNGPDDSAWYDFSQWPGLGGVPGTGNGNIVFSGHVDSGRKACKNGTVPPPCTAVFWDLKKLVVGDEIELRLADNVYKYRVTASEPLPATGADWNKILASTAQESMTLITCEGTFNSSTLEYDKRQVVTAIRVA